MAESSGRQSFVFITVFLITFFLLSSLIPTSLFANTANAIEIDAPDQFYGLDIGVSTLSEDFQIDTITLSSESYSLNWFTWTLGGTEWIVLAPDDFSFIKIGKRNMFLTIWISTDWMEFKNEDGVSRGEELTGIEMNADYTGAETWIPYRCVLPDDPQFSFSFFLGFDPDDYGSPQAALLNQELFGLQTMGLDDAYTALNAWNIVAAILFFEIPDVHPVLNIIIKAWLWAMIAWLLLEILEKILPF